MWLVIDVPKHRPRTSNNGNTARRLYQNPELTSEITRVNEQLISRFSIVLQATAFNKRINVLKFERYCQITAELYVSLCAWYYVPGTVHNILYKRFICDR